MSFPNFSVVTALTFGADGVWPPLEKVFFLRSLSSVPRWEVGADPNGQIYLAVWNGVSRDGTIEYLFQDVNIELPTVAGLIVSYEEGVPKLTLAGHVLAGAHTDRWPEVLIKLKPASGELSTEDPDAASSCAKAVQTRKDYFANRPPFIERRPSRPKSLAEQLDELQDATLSLDEKLGRLRNGNRREVGEIATALRALVLIPSNHATYNPLLLRLANARSLPLPVYMMRPRTPPTIDYGPPVLVHTNLHVGTSRVFGTEILGDFQDYLDAPILGAGLAPGQETATAAHLIAKLASSAAIAHYDETVALILDDARSVEAGRGTSLDNLVRMVGTATVHLGWFVLEAHGRKQLKI